MSDQETARGLATEVAGRPRAWQRMTTILDRFGETELTPETRRRIANALSEAGLVAHPPIEHVERRQSVRLEPKDAPPTGHGIRSEKRVGDVGWIDLDAVRGSGAELAPILSELAHKPLTPEHIEDLLSPDDRLTPEHFDAVWKLTTFDVEWEEPAALRIQSIELVVGDTWLVSCWHQPLSVSTDGAHYVHDPGHPRELDAPETVANPIELAAAILDQLSTGYGAAVEQLEAFLDGWELAAYRNDVEPETLRALRGFVGQFRHRLAPLEESLEELRETWPVAHVHMRVKRALKALERLALRLRSAFDLVTAHYATAQHDQSEALQDRIAWITALLIAPTFLASIAGVNTALPGQGSWLGFVALLVLMGLAAFATRSLLRRRA